MNLSPFRTRSSARLALGAVVALAFVALSFAGCARPSHPPGDVLYQRYCASCHGLTGKGDGPVAPSLQRPPTDLTTLARRSGSRFDEAAVMAIIDGRGEIAEHGTREMPVWGVVFDRELKERPYGGYTGLLRAKVLSDYLRSIQRK